MVRTAEGRVAAQAAVGRWYLRGLDKVGMSNSERGARYIHGGLKPRPNEQARRDDIGEVTPRIQELDLRVPDETANRRFL